MKGFFNTKRTNTPYKSSKGVHSCASCGLYKDTLSPKMEPYGKGKKGIIVLGEGPGEIEDRRGRPWQGRMGRALQQKYKSFGIDLFEDCISLNAINCRPTDDESGANRAPTGYEIACCRRRVLRAVKKYEPHVIILHGGSALESLVGYRWKGSLRGIMKWAGWIIPDRDFNAWICPTYHPSYVERQDSDNEVEVCWDNHLQLAFSKVDEPFPEYKDEKNCVVIVKDEKEIGTVLKDLNDVSAYNDDRLLAYDIECTGKKPYNTDEHEIVTISFCRDRDKVYAMPMPKDDSNIQLIKELLENHEIGKVAANMKFEDTWLDIMYGIKTYPWEFDTMLASHVLDNRKGICGLKFQAYVNFGLLGYEDEIQPYLKSSGSSYNTNQILELTTNPASFNELLVYNGIDSLVEYRLAKKQIEQLAVYDGWSQAI